MWTRALSLVGAAIALTAAAPRPVHAQPARPDAPAARTEGTVVRLDMGILGANEQSVQGGGGARLVEVGREFGRHLTVTARGGYGSRREDAAGFTVGGNVQLAF